jgi:Protein of unknown function (DUF4242)
MVARVAVFLVFRELPGVTRDQYRAAQRAVVDAIGQAADREISYGGGFFLPAEARAICLFDADSAAAVAAVNQQAGVPFSQVLAAIDLRTVEPPSGARRLSPRRQTC